MCHIILSSVACLVLPFFFPTLSHKRHYIREKLLNTKMCVFTFSTTFVYSYQIFMQRESSPQISDKDSNTKFHKNPFSGSRVVPCGMTGRQAWWRQKTLFAILRTRLKMGKFMPITTQIQKNHTSFWMGTIRSTTESMKGLNEMSRRSYRIACCAIRVIGLTSRRHYCYFKNFYR